MIAGGEGAIQRPLFLLAPNNSGSTFLAAALGQCARAWSLPREGQHVTGFHGPSSRGTGTRLLWAATPASIATFRDAAAYDWDRTRRAWYFHARAADADADTLVIASPPFLLIADRIAAAFPDAAFLIMVRNPYAVAEGIVRRGADAGPVAPGDSLAATAARHIVAALAAQAANRAALGARTTFFTYEQMCRTPAAVAARIAGLVPAFADLVLDRSLPVKGRYNEVLRDMNADQIARLGPAQLADLNRVFDDHRDLLTGFGYDRVGA
ncbi:sulfotransferase [Sphingopyxis sp. OPL5]|uniref:sulfotransferase n=1 Tax=Sphingopyxis sp. OPL5 TaxID=2486273 RepID=UPI00164E15BB|nr:sulfotransferase [Sphingopyxis sp. OPL5]QNO28760.1 sulfotransferase [Sphingopyxis sp. OPL5]